MALSQDFPIIAHTNASAKCRGYIRPEEFITVGESKTTLRCNECGLVVGTINTSILGNFLSLISERPTVRQTR